MRRRPFAPGDVWYYLGVRYVVTRVVDGEPSLTREDWS